MDNPTGAYGMTDVTSMSPGAESIHGANGMVNNGRRDGASFDASADVSSAKPIDRLLTYYFDDMRQFDLLSRDEEQALWQRILARRQRWQRALFLAPTTWGVLNRLFRKVAAGTVLARNVVDVYGAKNAKKTPATDGRAEEILTETMERLEALYPDLQEFPLYHTVPSREWRRWRAECLRAWCTRCEAVPWHMEVLESFAEALNAASKHDRTTRTYKAMYRAQQSVAFWQRQVAEVEAQMLCANLRFVVYIANKYRGQANLSFLDLVQEGSIGMMCALKRFQPARGTKFVTFAAYWVKQTVKRAIADQERTVRIPVHVYEALQRLGRVQRAWHDFNSPNIEELADALGKTPEYVQFLLRNMQQAVPLEACDGPDMAVDHSAEVEEACDLRRLREQLSTYLGELDEREAAILRLRFGFESDDIHTLEEIGAQYGLGKERIRQIENQALGKLRKRNSAWAEFL